MEKRDRETKGRGFFKAEDGEIALAVGPPYQFD